MGCWTGTGSVQYAGRPWPLNSALCEALEHIMEIGLSLGSNLHDRLANLCSAKDQIGNLDGVTVIGQSPVYETLPVDVPASVSDLLFLNAVLIIESAVDPRRLLGQFSQIENAMGRERRGQRNAPRPIDIDIVYAGQVVVEQEDIQVPHPRWASRAFVVRPLSDVRPDLHIPGTSQSVGELLLALRGAQKLVPFVVSW